MRRAEFQPREYKGWTIWGKNTYGMYVATNYGGGHLRVMAETLADIKQAINHTIGQNK